MLILIIRCKNIPTEKIILHKYIAGMTHFYCELLYIFSLTSSERSEKKSCFKRIEILSNSLVSILSFKNNLYMFDRSHDNLRANQLMLRSCLFSSSFIRRPMDSDFFIRVKSIGFPQPDY